MTNKHAGNYAGGNIFASHLVDSMLRVDALKKRYSSVTALDSVSFALPQATYAVVVGASGSGKSTLLRALAGLIEIDGGEIWLGERNLTPLSPHQRPVSTVFQSYALFPHMSVANNIAFGLEQQHRSAKEIRERTDEMLTLLRLNDLAQASPPRLSGGQQQRVALARALAVKPEIVLLDEPLGALDPALRHAVRHDLKRIQQESGVTFVHVTHDREEAWVLADHLLVMEQGSLIGNGTLANLHAEPHNLLTASYLGLDNAIPDGEEWIVFAPEHVVLKRDSGRWNGRIVGVHQLGAVTEREIALNDGTRIRQRSIDNDWDVDDRVWLDVLEIRRVTS
ncbi:MAG: ABC transporter ATP-binding protein [Thermomicrobiales bacterium]|nr:ABC transporter ATP-binding protein [Thermomicrobiales bacterium]